LELGSVYIDLAHGTIWAGFWSGIIFKLTWVFWSLSIFYVLWNYVNIYRVF
jgi:hypothetical protein